MNPIVRLGALALSLLGLGLAAARPARAEIIDFDPETQEVPDVLPQEDRDRLASFQGARFPSFAGPFSPDGAFGLVDGDEGMAVLDVAGGASLTLPSTTAGLRNGDGYSSFVVATGWAAPHTLVVLAVESHGEGDQATDAWYRLELAADGTVQKSEKLDGVAKLAGNLVAYSPGLDRALVLRAKGGGTLPDPVVTTLGPPELGPAPRLIPDGLPGRVGQGPLGPLEIQQVASELVVQDLLTGDQVQALAVDLPADSGLASVSWSADGRKLAVTTRTMPGWDGDRARDNDPPGSALPNLASLNVQEALGLIKPQDNPLVTGGAIQVVETTSGAAIGRLAGRDFTQGMLADLSFDPSGDGALLTLVTRSTLRGRPNPTYANPEALELHLLDGALKPVRKVVAPGWDSQATRVEFMADGTLAAVVPVETASHVQAYDPATGAVRTLWASPGAIYQLVHGGSRLGVVQTTAARAYERFTLTTADPRPVQLSYGNAALSQSGLRFETVRWSSSKGQAMEGTFIHHAAQPFPPARPGPVVVWQQGGPGGQMVSDWGTSVESPYSVLPNFGIPVFMVNAVGRNVKSGAFYSDMAQDRNFGQLDIQQVKEGVDELVRQGVADAARVGITGCSYGGYFTLQSLRAYPGFYAAANPQCSLIDLTEEFTMGYTPFVGYLMGRAPMADPAEYLADSPLYGAKDIRTPTLIFHGMEDFLPVPLVNNLHDQLAENGTPVTFLRVAGEEHGFSDDASQAYAAQLQLQWFREHLDVAPFTPHAAYLPSLGHQPAPGN